MSVSRQNFLTANSHYRASFTEGELDAAPARRVAVVTCMDARIDVYAALGLRLGEANVIRNAGGIITDDVIRSLCISQQRLGTTEVAIIHHTKCGMHGLDEQAFVDQLAASTGSRPMWAVGAFDDAADDVRASVAALVASPFLAYDDAITGYVYDVDSGSLEIVAESASSG